MSPQAKWEYYAMIYVRYHKAKSRKEKSQIVSEFCLSYDCHRKHALRLLNGPPPAKERLCRKRRKSLYSSRIISILESVWKASDYPWSVRLKETVRIWMPWIRDRFALTANEQNQILSISAAQIDRRLKAKKQWIKRKVYGSTRPGAILKHQIPVRTDSWNIRIPGYIEADLVSHCGGNASGIFAHTLTWTDIHTQWVERRALLGKGQFDVLSASRSMRETLPFNLRGLDCDNDSSFINELLFGYCKVEKIQFTRGRPYKKNDNAHIEQKNNTHVRQILGYVRYDRQEVVDRINSLYMDELHLFQNYFQPSVKLIKKIRIGSKVKKKYDQPLTPYQRALQSGKADHVKLGAFRKAAQKWNPFQLSDVIDQKLTEIYKLASKTPKKWLPTPLRKPKLPSLPLAHTPSSYFPNDLLNPSPLRDYRQIYKKEKFLKTW